MSAGGSSEYLENGSSAASTGERLSGSSGVENALMFV